jgi:hypothetical protein
MAVLGELLFFRRDQVDLDTVLRHQSDAGVREAVDQLPDSAFAQHTDEEITEQVAITVRIAPLALAFESAKADVEEATVEANNIFGERARLKGLRATKAIPFTGDANLWHLRTNPFDHNPPRGEVRGKTVVVGMEVPEQQGDQAVAYIEEALTKIKEWLKRQEAQLAAFNDGLPARVLPYVAQRRARLDKATDLRRKLQGKG